MDENTFFREATLRICGNLEIEVALFECLDYLKKAIPVESANLSVWESDIQAIRVIARATSSGGKKTDHLIPMPPIARKNMDDMQKSFSDTSWPDTDIINDSSVAPGFCEVTKYFNLEDSPGMHLILETEDRQLCSILVFGRANSVFTEQDAKVLDLLKRPLSVAMSNTLKHLEILKLKDLLTDDNRYLHRELHRLSGDEIIGANFGLKDVLYKVQQVAALNSPVLLLGETGVGKDVIANTIHYSSTRSKSPFISVNCGAIPDSLIDSELFGHEKGAFTGALLQKRGRFERADKGTIFLDEIGELPLLAQVRLLKVLQSKEIERVGGVKTISLDIRIIAATNRNLEEMVKLNEFREDLWFRLNVFPIWIPPLRDRKEDIPALMQHFISIKARELNLPIIPTLLPGAIDALMNYHWPGNVRELENIVERALILNPSGPLAFDNLLSGQIKSIKKQQAEREETDNLDEVVSRHIRQVLSRTQGKVHGPDGAAAVLGINPSTLRNRMNKLGIEYGRKSKS
jgi:transcriptional regulator with GAF, ATPase, and Fis domain